MLTTRQDILNVTQIIPALSEAKQLEESRKQEVQLLIENLFEREEATIKMILDCLYDIGATNLINQKISLPIANRMAKKVAKLSKGGIRIIIFNYVRKKWVLSGFITNFLLRKLKATLK